MGKTLSRKLRDEMDSPAYKELDELVSNANGWGDCSLGVTLDGTIEFECHIEDLPYIAQEVRDALTDGEPQAVIISIFDDDRERFLEYLRSIQQLDDEQVERIEGMVERGEATV